MGDRWSIKYIGTFLDRFALPKLIINHLNYPDVSSLTEMNYWVPAGGSSPGGNSLYWALAGKLIKSVKVWGRHRQRSPLSMNIFCHNNNHSSLVIIKRIVEGDVCWWCKARTPRSLQGAGGLLNLTRELQVDYCHHLTLHAMTLLAAVNEQSQWGWRPLCKEGTNTVQKLVVI